VKLRSCNEDKEAGRKRESVLEGGIRGEEENGMNRVKSYKNIINNNFVASVREQTIQTERLPLVGEVSVNFCG
jgi:hypothetical protein